MNGIGQWEAAVGLSRRYSNLFIQYIRLYSWTISFKQLNELLEMSKKGKNVVVEKRDIWPEHDTNVLVDHFIIKKVWNIIFALLCFHAVNVYLCFFLSHSWLNWLFLLQDIIMGAYSSTVTKETKKKCLERYCWSSSSEMPRFKSQDRGRGEKEVEQLENCCIKRYCQTS